MNIRWFILISISKELKSTYVYWDSGIKEKYADPYIYGSRLGLIMKDAAKSIIKDKLREISGNILVVEILEGGRFYYIPDILKELGIKNFEVAKIDIKSRFKYDPKDVPTKIVDKGNILEKIDEVDTVLMGETIASGSTMETFINFIGNRLNIKTKLIILGFHTYVGIERTIRNILKFGFNYEFYSYGGLLGLGSNKTDMTIGHKPNSIPDEVRRYSYSRLGKYIADRICVIGDFTNSFKYIGNYLAERVIQLNELYEGASREDRNKIVNLIREGVLRMMNIGLPIDKIEDLLTEEYRRRMKLIGMDIEDIRIKVKDIIKLD